MNDMFENEYDNYTKKVTETLAITIEPLDDKTKKMTTRPAKTQISLGIRPVWSESSLSAWRKLRSLATHWAHSEDSDQTGRMPRLIWVFNGRTATLLVLSWNCAFHVYSRIFSPANIRLTRPCKIQTFSKWHLHCIEMVQLVYDLYFFYQLKFICNLNNLINQIKRKTPIQKHQEFIKCRYHEYPCNPSFTL